MLLYRHLNKTGSHRSLYRGIGSIAFSAACRSTWLAAPDPEDQVAVDPESDLEPWLAPLRERFPPSTPLDD